MEYNVYIADLVVGTDIEGFYILKSASAKSTAAGKPFLAAVLSDVSGSIDAKLWDFTGGFGAEEEGKVVKIRGSVSEYRGLPQITIDRIRLAEPNDQYDMSALVPVAPIDVDAEMAEMEAIIASIEDADYRTLTQTMLQRHYEVVKSIPAAKSVHHGFISGLLMHTVSMLRLADFLSDLYFDVVDRSLLLAGTALHDFAKEKEFTFSELGLVTDYTAKGHLLGHLVMGAQEVAQVAIELGIPEEKSVLLQHMILSHHGEPELGAAVKPICAESELLSKIDWIDSRMEIYRETFDEMNVGEMSNRIFALDKRIYRHF